MYPSQVLEPPLLPPRGANASPALPAVLPTDVPEETLIAFGTAVLASPFWLLDAALMLRFPLLLLLYMADRKSQIRSR